MRLATLLSHVFLPVILLTVPGAVFAKPKQPLPWSFQQPKRPVVPAAGQLRHGKDRYRNAIDGFVLAALEQRDLAPRP